MTMITTELTGPVEGGKYGVPYNPIPPALAEEYGYAEAEYFMAGEATAYLPTAALAERIKADPKWQRIPLIALSSHSSPQLIEMSRAAGFASYVGKFDRQGLLAALKHMPQEISKAA